MKVVLICILSFLFLVNGCNSSSDVTKNEVSDECGKQTNIKNIDYVSNEVEKNTSSVIYSNSELNQTTAVAEVLLNPKWLRRLGDTGTYLVNYNEQISIGLDSILMARKELLADGFLMSPCKISSDGSLVVSIIDSKGIISNFSDLLDSYNEIVKERNAIYKNELTKFQNDFRGTKFTIKSKKFVNEAKPYALDNTADSEYLKSLYENRLKELLVIQGG